MKKILALFLVICMLVPTVISCKKSENSDGESADSSETNGTEMPNPNGLDISNAAFVYRQVGDDDFLSSATYTMGNQFGIFCDKLLKISDDFLPSGKKPDSDICEFLIGDTNRPESKEAMKKISGERFAYYVGRIKNKVVIVGTTVEMTMNAVGYFNDKYVNTQKVVKNVLDMEDGENYISKTGSLEFARAGKTSYSIRYSSDFHTNQLKNCVDTVSGYIRKYTVSVPVEYIDNLPESAERSDSSKEILVGTTYYKQTVKFRSELAYNEYGVKIDGKKIVIFGQTDKAVKMAVEMFGKILKRNTKSGVTVLPRELTVTMINKGSSLDIPYYDGGDKSEQRVLDVGGDGSMVVAQHTDKNTFENYKTALKNVGFELYAARNIAKCEYTTFVKDKLTVQVNYDATDSGNKTVRIVADIGKGLPQRADENKYEKVTTSKFAQLFICNLGTDSGMSYILRLCDGRFIVIDGGDSGTHDADNMYHMLCDLSYDKSKKPVIAAWFLTHSHTDHQTGFLEMADRFKTKLKIEQIVYNFPTEVIGGDVSQGAKLAIEEKMKLVYGSEMVVARTGQQFHIANAVVDVMFTPEEAYPVYLAGENNNSVIYKITCEGQSIMILGDCEPREARILEKRYGKEMKADMIQVAHHGYWGSTYKLNEFIDPEIVFWPCPVHWFHEALRGDGEIKYRVVDGEYWNGNQFFLDSENVKQIFNSGYGTVVLDLPYDIPSSRQHITCPTYSDGEIIYEQDFESVENVWELGWYGIKSSRTSPSRTHTKVTIKSDKYGDKGVYLQGGIDSVLNIVIPDKLAKVDVFTMEMTMNIDNVAGGFSVRYNDERPHRTVFDNRCDNLITKHGDVEFKMTVDRTLGTTTTWINGEKTVTTNKSNNNGGGIMLNLNGSQVFISNIKVTAGR